MDRQHGEFNVEIEGNIIFSTLSGSFNDIGALRYTESVKDLIRSLEGAHFCILIDNTRLEGGTPEAYQILENYNQWMNQIDGLIAKAYVVKSDVTIDMIEALSPSMRQQHNRSFKMKSQALTWLKSLI